MERCPTSLIIFGKLIGSWKIAYVDNRTSCVRKGEWHFSWILEGMAIQDVIVLPGFEYGTTLRVYNPGTHALDVAYCFTGKIMRFEARKQGGQIVLTNIIEDERRNWVFVEIEDHHFHRQDVTVDEDGRQVQFDLFAERA